MWTDVVCHKAEDEALVRNRGILSGLALEKGTEGALGPPHGFNLDLNDQKTRPSF